MKRKILVIVILLSTIVINAFSVLSLEIYNNTLHNSKNWINLKTKVVRGVSGAASFMNTMPALFKFKLNLATWQGHHKLIFTQELQPKEISFKYKVDKEQFFSFLFNSDEKGIKSYGIRISNSAFYPSMYFQIENEKFTNKLPLTNFKSDDKNHLFKIKFDNEAFTIFIDNQEIFRATDSISAKMHIGFKSGLTDLRTDIDDLIMIQQDGTRLEETFFNWKLIPELTLYCLAVTILVFGLLYFLLKRRFQTDTMPILKILSYVNFNLLILSLFVYAAMYSTVSRIYFEIPKVYNGYPTIKQTEEVVSEFVSQYGNNKNKPRIWFIGSSQTWGSGVYREEDTFVRIIEKELQKAGYNIECINGGVSGFTSAMALDVFNANFDKFKPDYVILNLSHNDAFFKISPDEFIKNLRAFVEKNRVHHVTTILVVEPVETHFLESKKHQDIMREFAVKENIPLIDVHNELVLKGDDGFLWWDRVHLTSYGNLLFAQVMLDPLKKIINTQRNFLY
ncbi:MAG TPA: SGNH/GDSL hydrolase family protein [Leptospiraceae bacterium]|nr:SGNH/GDSL hydrolase family protein [Leptospiraceae bacterium]HMX35136.1 SGNH/GDSL hydrolase family protein [Leptospiraceae bacterium]HMY34412.1 SGNH/GDSL hydrolase family protein [Leptospiraceae bacterium]HMZ66851.1 SGNH/GDSL hydrolase family protein [Leptospiraceae bacterium]HNA10415.1 SGNH/GDSL hydrolase family protein [Leptospiraceae bacterium]